jgi:hypothetical protein
MLLLVAAPPPPFTNTCGTTSTFDPCTASAQRRITCCVTWNYGPP